MFNTKKIFALLFVIATVFSVTLFTTSADEEVTGSFTTTGERAVPVVTVLGLYNSAGNLVNPGSGSVTPNTRHSIRFTLTNEARAFSDLSIKVAFFQSFDGSESDFDSARTDIYGDAFVARIDETGIRIVYDTGVTADDVSWDDTHFNSLAFPQKVNYLSTDTTYEFHVFFNMSKVASAYSDYYIGVSVDQTVQVNSQDETLSTYQSEGYYLVNNYTEFSMTPTSLTWALDADEIFTGFDGSSDQSKETITGEKFSIISNVDIFLDIYADTTWSGQDLDFADDPDAKVEAYLVDYTPSQRQEFALYYNSYYTGNISGNSSSFGLVYQTTERGASGPDIDIYLEVFQDNFENGVYNGKIYITSTQSNIS